MPRRRVTLRAVTRLFIERQHLARPRATTLTAPRLRRFVEDVGGIQLDSINVLDRAHYLTIWSRFGPYDRAWLDRQVYRHRLLFEYWAHAACLVPASALPWWRRAMLDYKGRHTGWSGWLRRNAKMLRTVREAVRSNGPMANGDFEGRRPPGGGGWWSWRPAQHALHHLWMSGALTIHSRQHFQKRYDLLERAMPTALGVEAVTAGEFQRWHVERCFEDEKSELGLSHFEVRTYRSLIRHLRITAVSHLFLAKVHHQLSQERGEPEAPDRLPGPNGGERFAQSVAAARSGAA